MLEGGGGAHEPMRCAFKLTRGRYIFTFSLALPGAGKGEFCLSGYFLIPSASFRFPVTLLLHPVRVKGGYFG